MLIIFGCIIMNLNEIIVIREEKVDDIGPWVWLKQDVVTFPIIKGEWERIHKNSILKYCDERRMILQAGGNCGMYPKLLSKMFNLVYTLEPDPLNFFCLTSNCPETNVIKIVRNNTTPTYSIKSFVFSCSTFKMFPKINSRVPIR